MGMPALELYHPHDRAQLRLKVIRYRGQSLALGQAWREVIATGLSRGWAPALFNALSNLSSIGVLDVASRRSTLSFSFSTSSLACLRGSCTQMVINPDSQA